MLDTNPVTRWTVPKILGHPWFAKHHPADYVVPNYVTTSKDLEAGPLVIDDDVIVASAVAWLCVKNSSALWLVARRALLEATMLRERRIISNAKVAS